MMKINERRDTMKEDSNVNIQSEEGIKKRQTQPKVRPHKGITSNRPEQREDSPLKAASPPYGMHCNHNHNHRPCRWFAQDPLGPFACQTYRLIEIFSLA